jgi:serine/threonine-protein kinase Chk1
LTNSVYRATNFDEGRVAAIKVVFLTESTTERERKALDREMRIHGALDNEFILNFMDAVIVDNTNQPQKYIPGVYMLLELAGGGDLFDKIGASMTNAPDKLCWLTELRILVPNVGIDADVAQHYFVQLASGVVCRALAPASSVLIPSRRIIYTNRV